MAKVVLQRWHVAQGLQWQGHMSVCVLHPLEKSGCWEKRLWVKENEVTGGLCLFYAALDHIATVIFRLFYWSKTLSVIYHKSYSWHDKTCARMSNIKTWYWVPVKDFVLFPWDIGTETSPHSSASSLHPLCLYALWFWEIRLTWGSLKHP